MDGGKIRVKLPEGYALFQKGEAEADRRLKSARLRRYELRFGGRVAATLYDYVHASARGVRGNVAYGGFTHSLKTRATITDPAIPGERRLQSLPPVEGIGEAARAAASAHARLLAAVPPRPARDTTLEATAAMPRSEPQ